MPGEGWLVRGEGSYEFGYESAIHILDGPSDARPTAIIAFNDLMAIGVIEGARSIGLQAGIDFAVTGFDDAPFTQYLNPPLTTVRQPVWEIGERAIELLLNILNGRVGASQQILVAPELVIRRSSDFRLG